MSEDQYSAYYAVIPGEVRYDPELTPNAKLLFGELTSLCNKTGYCWARNDYFADLYDLSISTISRLIGQLEKKGYIKCEMVSTETGSERHIYAGMYTVKDGGVGKNAQTPPRKKSKRGVRKNAYQNNNTGNSKQDNTPPTPPTGGGNPSVSMPVHEPRWFARFWQLYPPRNGKRVGRQAAVKAWDKLKPDRELAGVIGEALKAQKQTEEWIRENGRYIPMASTWLNGRRWEDEISPEAIPENADGWAPDPEVT